MISCSFPPAIGTTQICGVFVFAFRSTSTAANSTHFPSGEGTGSSTRLSAIMSSKVKGCLVWEAKGSARKMTRTNEPTRMTTSGRRPNSLIHPGIHQPDAAAFKVRNIASGENCAMRPRNSSDLCGKIVHESRFRLCIQLVAALSVGEKFDAVQDFSHGDGGKVELLAQSLFCH